LPNSGGGGGGAGSVTGGSWNIGFSGKSGASGVVIVRYTPTEDRAWTASAQQDIFTATTPIPTANNAAFTAEAWVYPTTTTGTWRNVFGSGTASNRSATRP
jgi:hypothetical protein